MNQTLHIFRKDTRRLWPYVLTVVLLIAMHSIYAVKQVNFQNTVAPFSRDRSIATALEVLTPLALWVLIALLVFQEPLSGDRHFWLTRPYRRASLFASKLLFIGVFVLVPFFLADCWILAAQDFAVVTVLSRILLHVAQIALLFVLPALALASLTATLAQFLLACFLFLLLQILETLALTVVHSGAAFAVDGYRLLLIFAVAPAAIVIWQYATRRTRAARIAAVLIAGLWMPGGILLIVILPSRPQASVSRAAAPPDIWHIAYDLTVPPRVHGTGDGMTGANVAIPLDVEGLPPETLLRGSGQTTVLIDGRRWPDTASTYISNIEHSEAGYHQSFWMTRPAPGQVVTLRTLWRLELVTDEPGAIVPARSRFAVPGVGPCRFFFDPAQSQLSCRAGLEPTTETAVKAGGTDVFDLIHPDSVPWGLTPTTDFGPAMLPNFAPDDKLTFVPRRLVTEAQTTITSPPVDLARYLSRGR